MNEFDVAVIGAGAAGLTVALGAAEFNKTVVLFEKHKIGGDCTHYGCMPSKTLIHRAKLAHYQQRASKYGLPKTTKTPQWSNIRKQIQTTIQGIHTHEQELLSKANVTVIKERTRFIDNNTLQAAKQQYTAKKIYICTGSTPRVIEIIGQDKIPIYTNETIFSIQHLPDSIAILGGGPIGCEIGQALSRLGVHVHIITSSTLLDKEDGKASQILHEVFEDENIQIHTNTTIQEVIDKNTVLLANKKKIVAQAILMSIGRVPNTQQLGLEHTSVQLHADKRIHTNNKLKAAKNIYALGDCTSKYQFSHVSEEHGRVVLANMATSPFSLKSLDETFIPRVTYTNPEIAHIGPQEYELTGRYETFEVPFSENDRAKTEKDTTGFVRIHTKPLSGRILAATIVGKGAGDLLALISLAIHNNIGIRAISKTIQAYPTRAQLIRHTADYWYRDYLQKILRKLGF